MSIKSVLENAYQQFTRDEMANIIEIMGLSKLGGVTLEQLRSIPATDSHYGDQFHLRFSILVGAYIAKYGVNEVTD